VVERFGVRVVVFIAPHTDTDDGRRAKFDGVISLPAAYSAGELVRALHRGARVYAGSPVYQVLMQLARWSRASCKRACTPPRVASFRRTRWL
jgi:hypothetical protein